MILLLGASGYMGRAFVALFEQRRIPFHAVSRLEVDGGSFPALLRVLKEMRPEFLINAAGYTGKPNVDACELARADTLQGNVLLPANLSHACHVTGIPWGHISSGCIFNGAKVTQNHQQRLEVDLTTPAMQALVYSNPGVISGFTEEDEPNFSFRRPPCSFYSGTKALAEEILSRDSQVYIWRLRIPFDEVDDPRNFLTKLQTYPKVYDNVNSISHRDDYVRACFALWERKAPFGIYNVTNPGFITSRQVVELITAILKPSRPFEYWSGDGEFYAKGVKTPRSNCVMDPGKLLRTGIPMRSAREALEHALHQWKKAP